METFDYNKVLAVTDGDKDLVVELVGLYQEQMPQLLDDINRAIQTGDTSQLQQTAHMLKGASGNVGAMAIYELAMTLETVGKNNEMTKAAALFEVLKQEAAKFEQATVNLKGASAQ